MKKCLLSVFTMRRFLIIAFSLACLLSLAFGLEFAVQSTAADNEGDRPSTVAKSVAASLDYLGVKTRWGHNVKVREFVWLLNDAIRTQQIHEGSFYLEPDEAEKDK